MAEINIALECFGSILTLILLGSLLLHGDRSNPSTRLFVEMLLVNLVSLWADAWAWYWNGTEHVVWNWLGNFLQYLSGYVLLFLYCQYLLVRASLWTTCPWIRRSVAVLCLLGIGLTVLTQFTGLFYIITPEHLCLRGEGFWLSQAIGMAALALVGGGMGVRQKGSAQEEGKLLPMYVLLPMGILALEMVWAEITLLGIGATLTLVLVFVNVQLQRDRRLRAQDKELAEKKIAIMLSQIQPHFLYNVLGSIEWLCETNPQKAQEATDELARFLRGNMDSLQSTRVIPASRELEHVRCYLSLERIRFGSHLRVEYAIETSDFFLPALSLQPLVENAVRHGVTKREEGGTIWISAREVDEGYQVTIRDDGVGFDPNQVSMDGQEHVGIENVRSRLAAQCGGTLCITSQEGVGTVAQVQIPKTGVTQGKESFDANYRGR